MSLLNLAIIIIVVGLLLWAVNRFIPMESRIKSILGIVVVIGVLLYVLQSFGIFNTGVRLK